jgi:Fe-only nitrogenase accessory protein AnfO
MVAEIAAMVGADGNSSVLNEPGTVVVYRRAGNLWEVDREMMLSLDQSGGLREMRRKMGDVISFLNGCTIFVARTASGALYFELEKAGCSVWEISGKPADFLDIVLEDEEKEKVAADAKASAAMPAPQEKTPGSYFISLKEVQGKRPELTSKQILQQFVTEGHFDVLEMLCDHVPPWIEMEAVKRGYTLDTEQTGPHEVMVRLMKNAAA